MNDNFEKRLQKMTPREIPSAWREKILDSARRDAPSAASPAKSREFLRHLVKPSPASDFLFKLWCELVWPKPVAWAGVAAAWVLILVLKISTQDASQLVAQKSSASPEAIAEVRQQKRFFAELVGIAERPATASAGPVLSRPRSERRPKIQMG